MKRKYFCKNVDHSKYSLYKNIKGIILVVKGKHFQVCLGLARVLFGIITVVIISFKNSMKEAYRLISGVENCL